MHEDPRRGGGDDATTCAVLPAVRGSDESLKVGEKAAADGGSDAADQSCRIGLIQEGSYLTVEGGRGEGAQRAERWESQRGSKQWKKREGRGSGSGLHHWLRARVLLGRLGWLNKQS